jgi:hypothetical protein
LEVGGEVSSTPTVGDLDGDGMLEVVFASWDGKLYVASADGTFPPGWPVDMGAGTGRTPSLADVDGDGKQEIFMGALFKLLGIRYDGEALPGWPFVGPSFTTVALDDLEGDGTVEAVAMGRNGHAYVFRTSGDLLPGWPYYFGHPGIRSNRGPAVGDVDGDGVREIAIPLSSDPSLYLFDLDATVRPGFPISLTASGLKQGVSMADLDRNGVQELIFQDRTGVYVLDGQGDSLPGWPLPPVFGSVFPAIGDVDKDGRLEMVYATRGGDAEVYVIRDDGSIADGWPVVVPAFSFVPQPTLGDIDGDGGVDIVAGGLTASFAASGRIYAWHADGTPVSGFPLALPDGKSIIGSSVTITDLDEDGDVDLLVGAATGSGGPLYPGAVFAFDLEAPFDPSTMEWPTRSHDERHTNRYEPPSVPNAPPVADAGDDTEVECGGPAGAQVVLDGSGSNDPDSTVAGDGIVLFEWYEAFGTPGEVLLGVGEIIEVGLNIGVHTITLRVTDQQGASDTDEVMIAVIDTVAPDLLVVVTPDPLWPPNHRMIELEVRVSTADLCGPSSFVLVSVTSSEPDDAAGGGDGSRAGDIQGEDPGTSDLSFGLRAERDGRGNGRVYTIVYEATDASGNTATEAFEVFVPHDLGGTMDPLMLTASREHAGTVLAWEEVPGAQSYDVVRGELANLRELNGSYRLV